MNSNIKGFSLSHGQVELVLWDKAWGNVVSDDFKAQIKYLRKRGIPKVGGSGHGTTAYYSFNDTMELALALAIRGQGFNVKDIDVLFAEYRDTFHRLFEEAYTASHNARTLYLQLGTKYTAPAGKGIFSHKHPELIDGEQLASHLSESGSWFTGLFAITKMVDDICTRAASVPEVKRGR